MGHTPICRLPKEPNGAGKTTTLRMIMSILSPDRGELAVLGRPAAIEAKDRIGYLPEGRGVFGLLMRGRPRNRLTYKL